MSGISPSGNPTPSFELGPIEQRDQPVEKESSASSSTVGDQKIKDMLGLVWNQIKALKQNMKSLEENASVPSNIKNLGLEIFQSKIKILKQRSNLLDLEIATKYEKTISPEDYTKYREIYGEKIKDFQSLVGKLENRLKCEKLLTENKKLNDEYEGLSSSPEGLTIVKKKRMTAILEQSAKNDLEITRLQDLL